MNWLKDNWFLLVLAFVSVVNIVCWLIHTIKQYKSSSVAKQRALDKKLKKVEKLNKMLGKIAPKESESK